ncbi:sigma-70 family RNA polymerase sigma factor [uncultured Aquimarina sp.]|uniref:RNA polymerase sigma factor n=1 Tax=uncultured Aquimarina sp. TaxID=575652 RepID=UPI0026055033|nr:sigma-70 family RNA polymerase sigma factor [uncultured Aquimarina sp.]
MSTIKNRPITEGIINGNHQVLKSFYKKNLPIVRRFILQYYGCTEDVEDIFQEAMILLYHQLRYKNLELPKASIHSYFIGICKNLWRNQLRKTKPLEHLELIENYIQDNLDSIDDIITRNDQRNLLHKHFSRLTDSNKEMLTMVFDGKSNKDIARITGCSEGYTRKKRTLSRKSLMELIFQDPLFPELKESSAKVILN